MAFAAPGVAVNLIDQLLHGADAVADDQRWFAAGSGNELVANDQNAVILTGQEAFDEHFVAVAAGCFIGGFDLFAGRKVDGDALALIAILGFDDDRYADLTGGSPGVSSVIDRATDGNRYSRGLQELLGQFLVLGDGFGDSAAGVGFGGLDAALLAAPAELHQAALGQAAIGDVAGDSGINDRAGTWAEADFLIQITQAFQRVGQIECCVINGGQAEFLCQFERQTSDSLFAVFDDDLIDTLFDSLRCAAESYRATGLRLQSERGKFQCVRHRRHFVVDCRLQQGDFREAFAQARLEFRDVGKASLAAGAGNNRLDGGMAAPQIRAAQGADT